MRLIILSPRLSRYRPLGKVPSTGPGGIVLASPFTFVAGVRLNQLCLKEWLRSRSGVDKRYFEGEVYKELRLKVKASARYARAEVKDVVRACPPYHPSPVDHIGRSAVLLRTSSTLQFCFVKC